MKRIFSLFSLLLIVATLSLAQTNLPPSVAATGDAVRRDDMTRVYITPKRVMWLSDPSLFGDTGVLLQPRSGQAEVGTRGMCSMHSTATDTASILLDFGVELHGGLKLVLGSSDCPTPVPMRIRFGESVGETFSDKDVALNDGYSFNDHAVRDFIIDVPRMGQIEVGSSGYRFVRIDLLRPETTIHLQEVTAILRYRDVPYMGSFHCSDARLDSIWMTGAYTVHLNMQEYLWDGVKRDRLIWIGDMHPEMNTVMNVFGQNDVIPRSIDLACEQYPQPNWLNGMSAYSMWYLIIQWEWYMRGGEKDFVTKHHDYIRGVIDHMADCVGDDGSEWLSPSRFLDWPSSPNTDGVESGYRALLTWALADGEKLCQLLGDAEGVQRCQDTRARLAKQVKQPNDLKQAAALMAIAGLMPAEEACQKYILPGGPKGFSTFYGYYMLEALAMAGHYEEAMDIISQYWGGMLDMGATTFWEDFDLDWTRNAARLDEFTPEGKDDIHGSFGAYCYPSYRHSFCHGWASGPTSWLTRHVLGFEVLEPGCRKVRIEPHLGGLQWAEGTVPTPRGTVSIRVDRRPDGTLKTSVSVPRGMKVAKCKGLKVKRYKTVKGK